MVMDQKVTREQIDAFFTLADVNGDGQITYEEFYQMFKNNIQDFAIQEKQKLMPTLTWMQKFAIKIDQSIKEARSSLLDMFQIID